ncbi:hypothetical protein [Campylobacter cuniculorum]|uniref:Crystallin beta/gamma motif-containing protein n=2 Tax=Campylobacter cuniculorum TaxID=374106 RepID=A0A1W6BVI6_9BACT|nr:hypothetical protein [Campylobacter cuniculorum]ARJ56106.1 crystallin beta/gamma motif-containing protein [Campylobacter cuniculorum DSM 23162 = LMG 24588]QOR03597.1 hypothetical protein A0071_05180 [Campylobacter cuniculorum]
MKIRQKELNNLDVLTQGLRQSEIKDIEISVLNTLYKDNEKQFKNGLNVFDSQGFLNALENLNNYQFKSQEAKDFIKYTKDFNKLFYNDVKIASSIFEPKATSSSSTMATSIQGSAQVKITNFLMDSILRNLSLPFFLRGGTMDQSISKRALKFQIERALNHADGLSDFKKILQSKTKTGDFSNGTRKALEQFTQALEKSEDEFYEHLKLIAKEEESQAKNAEQKQINKTEANAPEATQAKNAEQTSKEKEPLTEAQSLSRANNLTQNAKDDLTKQGLKDSKNELDNIDLNELLNAIKPEKMPKAISIDEFLSSLEAFNNKNNFLEHLLSKPDNEQRLALLNLIEPTFKNPDILIKKTENGIIKEKRLKKFSDGKDFFYLLVTKENDNLLLTGFKTNKLNTIKKELSDYDTIEYNADIIQTFIRPGSKQDLNQGLGYQNNAIISNKDLKNAKNTSEKSLNAKTQEGLKQDVQESPQETQNEMLYLNTDSPKGIKALREDLKAHLQPLLNKEIINKETNMHGVITQREMNKISSNKAVEKSLKNGFSTDEHFKASAEIKNLFENATLTETHADNKHRMNILAVHRFKSDLKINDKEATAKITLFEKKQGKNKIYTLELESLEKPTPLSIKADNAEMAVKTQSVDAPLKTPTSIVKTDSANLTQKPLKDSKEPLENEPFGVNFSAFYHKGKEAINHLLKEKQGQVKGAFYREDLGDISLVWGEAGTGKSDGFGLAKIAKYHPEVLENLDHIIKKGFFYHDEKGRPNIKLNDEIIGLRDNWKGKKIPYWIISSYKKIDDETHKAIDSMSSIKPSKENSSFTTHHEDTLTNKGLKDDETFNTKPETKELLESPAKTSPNIYQSNAHIGSGLAGGSIAGVERDEEGNMSFNPQKFLLGFLGGGLGSLTLSKGFKVLKDNPQFKEALKKELADTLAKGYDQAVQKYPFLETFNLKNHIIQTEKGRLAQANHLLNELEKREAKGIYNVTYNGKNATLIQQDLENIDSAIRYAKGDKNKGGKHIEIKHLTDSTKQGYVTDKELMSLGKDIREFLKEHEPYNEPNGSRVYEWKKDDVRFRVVINNIKREGDSNPPQLPKPLDYEIITFYSDRNLNEKMKFKNPLLRAEEKFNFNAQKAKDLMQWHKDSSPLTKDNEGLPIIFYHGSKSENVEIFKDFENGYGSFFSISKDEADLYRKNGNVGIKGLKKCFLKIKKPFLMDEVKIQSEQDYYKIAKDFKIIKDDEGNKIGTEHYKSFQELKDYFNTIKTDLENHDLTLSELDIKGSEIVIIDKEGKAYKDNFNDLKSKKLKEILGRSYIKCPIKPVDFYQNLQYNYIRNELDCAIYSFKNTDIQEYSQRSYTHISSPFKSILQSKGYDGIKFNDVQFSVFDSNQIKEITNKGSIETAEGEFKTATPKDTTKEGFKYFREQSPNIYQSNAHIGSGLAGGSLAGLEHDEEGNVSFNPQKFLLGFLGGGLGSLAVLKGFKYARELKTQAKINNKDLYNIFENIDKSTQAGSKMFILGKENLSPEVLTYIIIKNKKIAINKLNEEIAKELNFKYPKDVRRTIDFQDLKHILRRHGENSILVKKTGQKPISLNEIIHYQDLADSAEIKKLSKSRSNQDVLISIKAQDENNYIVIEQIKRKHNELALKTMYHYSGELTKEAIERLTSQK